MGKIDSLLNLIKGSFSFAEVTILAALKIIRSPQDGIKGLYGVSLYRNAVYLLMSSVATALTGFLFWVLAAKLYTAEVVGLSSAAISAASLLASISTLGLNYGLVRFLPKSGEKATELTNSSFALAGLTSIALSLVFLAGLNIWSPALLLLRQQPIFSIAFIAFTLAYTLFTLSGQVFVAYRRAGLTLSQGLIASLVRFVPLVLLPVLLTFSIFVSWGIAILVATVTAVLFFLPKVQINYCPLPILKMGVINEVIHFSLANHLASILWSIPALVLPLMVVNLLGAEQNAYFYIGWTMGNIIASISGVVSTSLFAEGSYDEKQLGQRVEQSLRFILLLLIPIIIIFLAVGDKILLFFGAAYSQNATKLLWLLAISALPLSINSIYFSIQRVQMKMKSLIALSAYMMVGTVGLSYFLLPYMGILGVGIAWLTSQGTLTAVVIARWLRGSSAWVRPV